MNVVLSTNRTEEKARERVLSNAELREIWAALPDDDYGDIVRLLMLTGQRREEIGALRWSELDFDRDVVLFPPARTKNSREHELPMSGPVRDLLEARDRDEGRDLMFGTGRGPFSGWSNAKEALDTRLLTARKRTNRKASPLPDWRIHDIRRTVATGMAEIGVQPHVIEAVFNHVSGHKAGVAGVYNRASYGAEKAAALTRWAARLREILDPRTSNILALRARA
jgi:integrase